MFNAGGRTPNIFDVGSVCWFSSIDGAHQFKMLRERTLLQVLGFCLSAIQNIAERDWGEWEVLRRLFLMVSIFIDYFIDGAWLLSVLINEEFMISYNVL